MSIGESNDCVIDKFQRDIEFNGSRYVTNLPFRPDHEPLPDNHDICEKRLKSLQRRLASDETLKTEYEKIFTQYEQAGIIEKYPLTKSLKNLVKLTIYRIIQL